MIRVRSRVSQRQASGGDEDQAIATCEKLLADDPFFAPAIRQLALLYDPNATDLAKAYDWAINARQAYPDDAEVAKTLGILSYRRAYYTRSADLLNEAKRKRPDDAEVLYYLGQAIIALRRAAGSSGGTNEPLPGREP